MISISDLDKHARPSLAHYIDVFIRQELGEKYAPYTDGQVDRVIKKIEHQYTTKTSKYPEITEALKNTSFLLDVKRAIVEMLENRPTEETIKEYIQLCAEHRLVEKKIAVNKNNILARIEKIKKTNGKTQDI
ncbi:hypothetical protein J2T12_003959 [Paenibacillus anaericanus]|uniref:hypothetical protein n=1 Tax=Paenibacillus anaericanus TaxID=170367 RepID=UPI002781C3E7|nr:hypothetical protein [Paenibacillus anaericanus]MDQ0090536.1 hypothetical protein [Paenibacillus anaericanus]